MKQREGNIDDQKEELKKQEQEITDDLIKRVIELFLEAGIEQDALNEKVCYKIKWFFVIESKWLTIEAITNLIRRFSKEERLELFHKINKGL